MGATTGLPTPEDVNNSASWPARYLQLVHRPWGGHDVLTVPAWYVRLGVVTGVMGHLVWDARPHRLRVLHAKQFVCRHLGQAVIVRRKEREVSHALASHICEAVCCPVLVLVHLQQAPHRWGVACSLGAWGGECLSLSGAGAGQQSVGAPCYTERLRRRVQGLALIMSLMPQPHQMWRLQDRIASVAAAAAELDMDGRLWLIACPACTPASPERGIPRRVWRYACSSSSSPSGCQQQLQPNACQRPDSCAVGSLMVAQEQPQQHVPQWPLPSRAQPRLGHGADAMSMPAMLPQPTRHEQLAIWCQPYMQFQ